MRLKMKCSIDSNTREIIFLDNSDFAECTDFTIYGVKA